MSSSSASSSSSPDDDLDIGDDDGADVLEPDGDDEGADNHDDGDDERADNLDPDGEACVAEDGGDMEYVALLSPDEVPGLADEPYTQTGPFCVDGDKQLISWFQDARRRLTDEMRTVLADYFRVAKGTEGCTSVGTACSGTDVAVMVSRAFHTTFCQHSFVHSYSCEKDEKKRMFLQDLFEGELSCLFMDTCDLSKGSAQDVVTRSMRPVPPCTDFFAGFPCTDVSSLNPLAPTSRDVIFCEDKRTGKVFNDCVHYLGKAHKDGLLELAIFENVPGLAVAPKGTADPFTGRPHYSNLDHCVHKLGQIDLVTVAFTIDPRQFGWPVRRQRVWLISFPAKKLGEAGLSLDEVRRFAWSVMRRLVTNRLRNWDDLILPAHHPDVQAYTQECKDAGRAREAREAKMASSSKKQKLSKWPERNAKAFEKAGLDWWLPTVPNQAVFETHPTLHVLSENMFDTLAFKGIAVPDSRPIAVDLSQAAARVSVGLHGVYPTVTPNGKLYRADLARGFLGQDTCIPSSYLSYQTRH